MELAEEEDDANAYAVLPVICDDLTIPPEVEEDEFEDFFLEGVTAVTIKLSASLFKTGPFSVSVISSTGSVKALLSCPEVAPESNAK